MKKEYRVTDREARSYRAIDHNKGFYFKCDGKLLEGMEYRVTYNFKGSPWVSVEIDYRAGHEELETGKQDTVAVQEKDDGKSDWGGDGSSEKTTSQS